jgi:antitoxin YefM
MKPIQIAHDVVPVATFKSKIAAWLQQLRENGRPLIITQNGKPAAVLVSPSEFDQLLERERFFDSLTEGLADADADRVMDSVMLRKRLSFRRAKKSAA